MSAVRAFFCGHRDFVERGIYFAESPTKAKYKLARVLNDVWDMKWKDAFTGASVRRAPQFDHCSGRVKDGVSETYLALHPLPEPPSTGGQS